MSRNYGFHMFLSSSQWVSITFSICSLGSLDVPPRVFPIAPRFNPICFAQRPPLLTYIAGLKGKALHLSIGYSIFGEVSQF